MAESWEMTGRERRYSTPGIVQQQQQQAQLNGYGAEGLRSTTAEDLHAWSIYRQNLNSDFADSALGSGAKTPLPYGNFQLDSTTSKSLQSFVPLVSGSSTLIVKRVCLNEIFSHQKWMRQQVKKNSSFF